MAAELIKENVITMESTNNVTSTSDESALLAI